MTILDSPFLIIYTLSQISRAVGLCIIMIQVGLCSKFLTDFNILTYVSESRADVASSNIRIDFFLRKALAIERR